MDVPVWLAFGRLVLDDVLTDREEPDRSNERGTVKRGDDTHDTDRDTHDTDREVGDRSELATRLGTEGPLAVLAANAALNAGSVEVLAVLLAAEVDWGVQHRIARTAGDWNRNQVPVGWLPSLFPDLPAAMSAVSPDSRLARAALIEVESRGALAGRQISVAPAVVWAVLGDPSQDPDLGRCEVFDSDRPLGETSDANLIVVAGPDRIRRRDAAVDALVARRFISTAAPDNDAAWAAMVREATLTGRTIIVEVDGELAPIGRRWIERADHVGWVVSSEHPLPIDSLPRVPWAEIEAPGFEATASDWTHALGTEVGRPHRLSLDQLDRVTRLLPAVGSIDAAVRRLAAGRLEQLTRRIRPTRRWDDLVLNVERRELLHSIVDRARLDTIVFDDWGYPTTPSRGLVVLFSGPSGTGKTLAAEIVAGELGLDLFKLNLSAVVSKYIGETEQRLDELFDAAGAGNAVLFFDEADALFGKRSEVRDARDRYANIEVSYLLQRLEAYDGVVILATNFEKNLDDAFLRRIHVRIEFVLPGVDERCSMWRQSFPATTPLADDIDVDQLADRFELSGGAIRNAALTAAFIAAAAESPVTMDAVTSAIAHEFRKQGRLIADRGL